MSRHVSARLTVDSREEEYVHQQEMLLHAVSHECRAPIARLRFALELVRPTVSSEGLQYLAECSDAIADIQLLVDEVMTYARFEAEPSIQREPTGLCELLKTAVESVPWPACVHPPEVEVGPDLLVNADRNLFCRVMRNLLRNAGRHAKSRVRIEATRMDAAVRVVVSDDGPGVPEHQRKRILEPFARVDESRSRETGGVGLGLAIVAAIVRAHAGHVSTQASPLGGAAFVTTWPDESSVI